MKKFKKLTASLMALAITAAGMSSIPAKAYVPSITRYTNFYVCGIHVSGVLSYTPGTSYYASTTAQQHASIQRVSVSGVLMFADGGSALGEMKTGRYQVGKTYTGHNVSHFRSTHMADSAGYCNTSSIYV